MTKTNQTECFVHDSFLALFLAHDSNERGDAYYALGGIRFAIAWTNTGRKGGSAVVGVTGVSTEVDAAGSADAFDPCQIPGGGCAYAFGLPAEEFSRTVG